MRGMAHAASLVLTALALTGVGPVAASAQSGRAALVASLDSAARAHVASDMVPGVSVAVVRRGDTLLQRGYGYVDLEWSVETPRDGAASYEIGSMTKQFTASSILLLAEEGKLDLDADFTKYIDFDTRGRSVPLRRLLDHTSGIKGYTEMEVFGELAVRKLPRDSLVHLVEREPFEFEPGTAQIYNNSAFFLLGLIIEAVSGVPYEDFVAERLFRPAGMTDSYYCSEAAIREHRAHGYDAIGPDALIRARYLDQTWPFAAGSLCSTVGDLARWNAALHGGGILSPASYAALTTPRPLRDGHTIRYAMGLQVDVRGGRRVIQHGGGINGFLSDGRYYPDDGLVVIVLQNATGPVGPDRLASALVDLVLGPAPEPPVATYPGSPEELAGSYTGPARGQTLTVTVAVEDGAPTFRMGDGGQTRPAWREGLTWALGGTTATFVRRDGRVAELHFDTGGGHYVLMRGGSTP